MFLTVLALCSLLLLPDSSYAWGPGFHLQLGTTVLNNLQAFPAAVAALIGNFPNDFLYGSISADITLGKKYTGYLLHCHRWHIGKKLLEKSDTDAQRACAYGYISHLAADTVAHCYYVPLSIMRSYQSVVMKHAYWEVRFDSFTPQEIWDRGRRVALDHFQQNDELLRREISNTIFSFGTNKKIFNSILLVSRLEKWQQLISAMNEVSRFQHRLRITGVEKTCQRRSRIVQVLNGDPAASPLGGAHKRGAPYSSHRAPQRVRLRFRLACGLAGQAF